MNVKGQAAVEGEKEEGTAKSGASPSPGPGWRCESRVSAKLT